MILRNLIIKWLFGIDNIKTYMELLSENISHTNESISLVDDHLKTLNDRKEDLEIISKLIRVCKNHRINVDEEIKYMNQS